MTTETFRAAAHDRHSKGRELAAQLLAHQNRDDPEGAFRMALFALMKAVRGRVDCEGVMLNVLVDFGSDREPPQADQPARGGEVGKGNAGGRRGRSRGTCPRGGQASLFERRSARAPIKRLSSLLLPHREPPWPTLRPTKSSYSSPRGVAAASPSCSPWRPQTIRSGPITRPRVGKVNGSLKCGRRPAAAPARTCAGCTTA